VNHLRKNTKECVVPNLDTNLTYVYNHPDHGTVTGTIVKGMPEYDETPYIFMVDEPEDMFRTHPLLFIDDYALLAPLNITSPTI